MPARGLHSGCRLSLSVDRAALYLVKVAGKWKYSSSRNDISLGPGVQRPMESPMPMITCPNCGTQLNAPDSLVGQQVTCGKCRCLFVAHSQGSPSSSPAEAPDSPAPNAASGGATPQAGPQIAPPPIAVGPVGYPQAGAYYQPMPLPTSGYAVASLVLGIASLALCIFYGLPSLVCGPLALVFSNMAGKDIRAGKVNPSSAGLAKAGKICGLIGLLLGILIVLTLVLGIVFVVSRH